MKRKYATIYRKRVLKFLYSLNVDMTSETASLVLSLKPRSSIGFSTSGSGIHLKVKIAKPYHHSPVVIMDAVKAQSAKPEPRSNPK